ncbi:MAG: MBL fold metallo-hydrolase, partial [Bacilli bacterium]|nr:MBL fold metallo-hydrolase [Bacilli bacterium]
DADYIFITHSHYDHYSKESILKVKKESTKIIVPKDLEEEVATYFSKENMIVVEPLKDYKVDSVGFQTVPAYNIHKSFHKKENGWVGYIIRIGEETYYIAGDTDNVEELHHIKCDTAFVPIGGTYTMNVTEAVSLIRTICPKKVIPIHYQTIVGTVEDAYEFQDQLKGITEVEILMK